MRASLDKLMRPDPRECEETRALMSDFGDGDLDDVARKRVERHVRLCSGCDRVLGNLRKTIARLRAIRSELPSPEDDAVDARVPRAWRDRV